MNQDRQEQIDALFVAASELDPAARNRYLDEHCRGDAALRSELRSLLAHHDPRTIIEPSASRERRPMVRFRAPALPGRGARRSMLRAVLWTAGAALVLGLVGTWVHQGTRTTIRRNVENGLESILDADVSAISNWLDYVGLRMENWADAESTRRAVASFVGAPSAQASPARNRPVPLTEDLERMIDDGSGRLAIIDLQGRIRDWRDGQVLDELSAQGRAAIVPVFRGETHVMPARHPRDLGADNTAHVDVPTIIAAAPVHDADDERVIGVAIVSLRADAEFARLLAVGDLGLTGETYAFDASGAMLSPSRFEGDLRNRGLLPADPSVTSVLNVEIRDPGGDLAEGHVPARSPATRPLTLMAAHATAGRDGFSVDPYRNYRGADVVGAWRWLDAYQIGIATEIGVDEAYSALNYVHRMLWLLFGLFAVSVFGVIATGFVAAHLRRRLGQVQRLGRYTLGAVIGEGGMGRVYEAHHAMLRRPTAIKLLRSGATDPATIARFEREVQLTSRLTHPNTIVIYDYGRTDHDDFYYAMEYLPGVSLADLVDLAGPLPVARAVSLLRQVSASLADAHDQGLVHRDVKPQNIMVCERGGTFDFVKVLDFGLVKESAPDPSGQITLKTEVSGTPAYIAPERLHDGTLADARCDVYSLGAVAFYVLTGRPVFEGVNAADVCFKAANEPAPGVGSRVRDPIPADLERLVDRCLARDPAARPATMHEVRRSLDVLSHAHPWPEDEAKRWWEDNADRVAEAAAARRATAGEIIPVA